MPFYLPAIIGSLWGTFEFSLALAKRSKSDATSKDQRSLGLIWLVALAAIGLGVASARHVPALAVPWPEPMKVTGCGLFAVGLSLRLYSIICLGRFFTTNVAISNDHRLIESGPYQFIRHPSYTGSLLAMFGCALTFANWGSIVLIFLPFLAINLWRIHIEEAALAEGLGDDYRRYMKRTKRLVPLIY